MSLKERSLFYLVINSNYDLVLLNISFKAIATAFFCLMQQTHWIDNNIYLTNNIFGIQKQAQYRKVIFY